MARPIKLSVVIPTYNRGWRIVQCLDALARQAGGWDEAEVIVVDDGSTDDTLDRLRSYPPPPFRLRVLTKPNGGCGSARNLGHAKARGEWVACLDDDCVVPPDWLRTALAAIAANPDAAAVGGLVEPISADGLVSRYTRARRVLAGPSIIGDRVVAVVTANALFRKASLDAIGGFDERFRFPGGEDVDVCQRLLAAGGRLVADTRLVVRHHHRQGLRPLLAQVYWYGHGSGLLNCKARRRPLRLHAPVKALSAAGFLLMTPLYAARYAASRADRLEGAAFGCIEGFRRAAYALGKARGLWRGFA
ncbi:MAG TPA: glycosyltransferase [Thermodesulfobacteriota bacterium]